MNAHFWPNADIQQELDKTFACDPKRLVVMSRALLRCYPPPVLVNLNRRNRNHD